MACIYCCKRKEDDKVVYVGLTMYSLEFRLTGRPYGHFYLAFEKNSQTYFHKALRKYGKDAFYFEMLEDCPSELAGDAIKSWLSEREKYWITYYDTFNHGYNQTTGGHKFYHRSEENRAQISQSVKMTLAKPEIHQKMVENLHKVVDTEEYRKMISERTKLAMSKLDTKTVCDPRYGRTEEQIAEWYKKQKRTAKLRADLAWSNETSRQKLLKSRCGRVWVHKNNERHFIKKECLQSFIDKGFSLGHGYNCTANAGKIWMNNGIKQCLVKQEDISSYIADGYIKGRLKRKRR